MSTRIVLENHFKDTEHFFHVLIHEVFSREGLDDLLDNITNIDTESDPGDRIFVEVYDILEYTIRMWNVMDDEDNVYVEYTLFTDKLENNKEE